MLFKKINNLENKQAENFLEYKDKVNKKLNSMEISQKELKERLDIIDITSIDFDVLNWKLYTSEKYKFSIRYPRDWEFYERLGPEVVFAKKIGKFPDVSITANSKNATSLSILWNFLKNLNLKNKNEFVLRLDSITIYGVSGQSITNLADGTEWYKISIVFEKGDFIYELSANNVEDEIFYNILKTLKFIK